MICANLLSAKLICFILQNFEEGSKVNVNSLDFHVEPLFFYMHWKLEMRIDFLLQDISMV